MISTWKQELAKRASELFARGNKAPAVGDAQKVIDDLHRKIGQLQVESPAASQKINDDGEEGPMQPRTCLLTAFTLIVITAVAFGAAAQQTSDQDAWQAGESVLQAYNKAMQARDAAGVAALFSEDAVLLTTGGSSGLPGPDYRLSSPNWP